MHDDTADDKKPDDHFDSVKDLQGVGAHFSVDGDFFQVLSADRKIEDCADADGTEEADECCLEKAFYLVDISVHCENDRQAADKKDENTQWDETIDRDDSVFEELVPWTDGSEPHKHCQIEQHINRWLKRVVHGLESEPVTIESAAFSNVGTYS